MSRLRRARLRLTMSEWDSWKVHKMISSLHKARAVVVCKIGPSFESSCRESIIPFEKTDAPSVQLTSLEVY